MKTLVLALAFVLVLGGAWGARAADKISFDGRDYFLVTAAAQGVEIDNQYLASGDSPDRWERGLSVRLFKGREKTAEVVADFLRDMEATLMDRPMLMQRDGAPDDVVLVLFLKMPGDDYFEYDLQRFAPTKDGVIGYRYAHRWLQTTDLGSVLNGQSDRIRQLFELTAGVKEAK